MGLFRMLKRHSNTIYGKNIDVTRLQILEVKASVGYGAVNQGKRPLSGAYHKAICTWIQANFR